MANSAKTKIDVGPIDPGVSVPDHVPRHLIRDLRFATGQIANDFDEPYQLTERLLEDDIPPLMYYPYRISGRDGGAWVVSRYSDIANVYQDAETYSTEGVAAFQALIGETWPSIPLGIDPPDHAKYRLLLNPYFSPKAIDALEPKIRASANQLIDGFIGTGAVDFAYDFARVYPVRVFLDLMGFPISMFEQFLAWEFEILHSGGDLERMRGAVRGIIAYLRAFIADTRKNPSDRLTSKIVSGRVDGRPLTEDETIGTVFFLWLGGLDTVASTLSQMFRRLSLTPALRKQLVDNPAAIPDAAEEFLRVQPLVNSTRKLKRDLQLHGVGLKKGDHIMCLNSVGNFDPQEFKCPREVRFDRQPNRHFTLAGGPHRCLGSHLARRELRVALEEWLRRIPEFEIKPGADRTVVPGLMSARHLELVWPRP